MIFGRDKKKKDNRFVEWTIISQNKTPVESILHKNTYKQFCVTPRTHTHTHSNKSDRKNILYDRNLKNEATKRIKTLRTNR